MYHPDVHAPDRETFPLQEGNDIYPTGRAAAYRHFMTLDAAYPHCQICHRAMLATDIGKFCCPDGHMTYEGKSSGVAWWQRILRVLGVLSNPEEVA